MWWYCRASSLSASGSLSKKHRRTLSAIFEKPTRGDVEWSAVVALIKRLGGTVNEKRAGSRVAFKLGARKFVLHKPHPGSTLSKGALESLRALLVDTGHKP